MCNRPPMCSASSPAILRSSKRRKTGWREKRPRARVKAGRGRSELEARPLRARNRSLHSASLFLQRGGAERRVPGAPRAQRRRSRQARPRVLPRRRVHGPARFGGCFVQYLKELESSCPGLLKRGFAGGTEVRVQRVALHGARCGPAGRSKGQVNAGFGFHIIFNASGLKQTGL